MASGWLELQQDQRVYRDKVGPLPPAEAARLDRMEAQEVMDRRALDQREALWVQSERRREAAAGGGARSQAPSPGLNLRLERAEAGERLRRDISRSYQGFSGAGN
jgi:hypothetical protein